MHYATQRKVTLSIPDEVNFFILSNPSSLTVASGSSQPLAKMNTRYLPRGKGKLTRKADSLTAICGATV
jgi:hypothetical protein